MVTVYKTNGCFFSREPYQYLVNQCESFCMSPEFVILHLEKSGQLLQTEMCAFYISENGTLLQEAGFLLSTLMNAK